MGIRYVEETVTVTKKYDRCGLLYVMRDEPSGPMGEEPVPPDAFTITGTPRDVVRAIATIREHAKLTKGDYTIWLTVDDAIISPFNFCEYQLAEIAAGRVKKWDVYITRRHITEDSDEPESRV